MTSSKAPNAPVGTRRARKIATRRALREAASAAFVERGFGAVTAGEIARAAGVAHGTFYVHFSSKEEVADELLADFNGRFAARLQPLLADLGIASREAIVRAVAGHFVDHWRSERAFVRVYAERTGSGLDIEALRDGVNPPMVAILQPLLEGLRGPAPAPVDVGLATHGLLGLWMRVGLQHVLGGRADRDTTVETLTALTVGALGAAFPESS